jgi:hypothetical protein
MQAKSMVSKFMINLGLLFIGSAMVISGVLIQFKFHMGHHGQIDTGFFVLGISYFGWSYIHKASIVILSILMVLHVTLDWKWYVTVAKKRMLARNKQVITLIVIFIIVVFTGYIPWFIKLARGSELTRKFLIEIHDKLTLVLCVYLFLHVVKRFGWFVFTFNKLRKQGLAYPSKEATEDNRQRGREKIITPRMEEVQDEVGGIQ